MFQRLKSLLKGKSTKVEAEKSSEIPWIPADENQWAVPVLDVRPVTHHVLSTSTVREHAENAISYGTEDGISFLGQVPKSSRFVPVDLRYRIDGLLAPGPLYIPREMEHKWAIYFHGGQIICVRSWLREVAALADVIISSESEMRITCVRGDLVGENESSFTARTLDYLIRTHVLGLEYPVPLPAGIESSPHEAAMWCMGAFGNRAGFATPHSFDNKVPEKPLRSHSLLHIEVARGNLPQVARYLAEGFPVGLLAADGLSPLHWALPQANNTMANFLLEQGSPVDVRSAEGATPLMTAVQNANQVKVDLLLARGADVNLKDNRGFTCLHRSAEIGNVELTAKLLKAGAKVDVESQGHTALSFARNRGHKEVVKMLEEAGE